MRRSDDRILTTHVGSIIRTPELRKLAATAKDNPGEVQKFHDAVRTATNDVVATPRVLTAAMATSTTNRT